MMYTYLYPDSCVPPANPALLSEGQSLVSLGWNGVEVVTSNAHNVFATGSDIIY